MNICKTIVRWTLIAGIAVGGVTILIGPGRVAAAFETFQDQAGTLVDQYIDVEEAKSLRAQLHTLAAVYPDRIAEIRGEIARIDSQIGQMAHDADVARRVVSMTESDLERLAGKVRQAEVGGVRQVSLVKGDAGVDLEVAYKEGRRIQGIRSTYQERLVADQRQVELLHSQHDRLATLLEQVEREYSQYQAQVWQLDRQIDSIERNERLIALTESQHETLQQFQTPGDTETLRAIETRLAELHAVQEGTLQALGERGKQGEYEHRARSFVNDATSSGTLSDPFAEFGPTITPEQPRQAASPWMGTDGMTVASQ
jgi:chromosome segregation ATPase